MCNRPAVSTMSTSLPVLIASRRASLTNRSTVVSDRSVIEAHLLVPEKEVFVTVDGQSTRAMRVGDVLRIVKSDRVLPLVTLPERSFPEVLRQKLKWSGSNV